MVRDGNAQERAAGSAGQFPVLLLRRAGDPDLLDPVSKKSVHPSIKGKKMLLEDAVASALRGEDGALPPEYCSDPEELGIHFTDEACQIWIDYLYTHTP